MHVLRATSLAPSPGAPPQTPPALTQRAEGRACRVDRTISIARALKEPFSTHVPCERGRGRGPGRGVTTASAEREGAWLRMQRKPVL